MSNRFDAFVNKILAESLQGGNISSIPSAMRGVGKTDSNTPPSPDPQITSAQNLPKAPETSLPKTMPKKEDPKDQEIKNEISKLPPDVQQKIASAKSVEEITSAIANVEPASKQKIEDYIKNYASGGENAPATPQNIPSI